MIYSSFRFLPPSLGGSGYEHIHWSQTTWVWIPALPLTTCVILDKLFKFTVPQFTHLWNWENNSCFVKLWELNEIYVQCVVLRSVQCLQQCLVHSECYVSVGFNPMYIKTYPPDLYVTNLNEWIHLQMCYIQSCLIYFYFFSICKRT